MATTSEREQINERTDLNPVTNRCQATAEQRAQHKRVAICKPFNQCVVRRTGKVFPSHARAANNDYRCRKGFKQCANRQCIPTSFYTRRQKPGAWKRYVDPAPEVVSNSNDSSSTRSRKEKKFDKKAQKVFDALANNSKKVGLAQKLGEGKIDPANLHGNALKAYDELVKTQKVKKITESPFNRTGNNYRNDRKEKRRLEYLQKVRKGKEDAILQDWFEKEQRKKKRTKTKEIYRKRAQDKKNADAGLGEDDPDFGNDDPPDFGNDDPPDFGNPLDPGLGADSPVDKSTDAANTGLVWDDAYLQGKKHANTFHIYRNASNVAEFCQLGRAYPRSDTQIVQDFKYYLATSKKLSTTEAKPVGMSDADWSASIVRRLQKYQETNHRGGNSGSTRRRKKQ